MCQCDCVSLTLWCWVRQLMLGVTMCVTRHCAACPPRDVSCWYGTGISGLTARGPDAQVYRGGMSLKQVVCGDSHAVAVHSNGFLMSWGAGRLRSCCVTLIVIFRPPFSLSCSLSPHIYSHVCCHITSLLPHHSCAVEHIASVSMCGWMLAVGAFGRLGHGNGPSGRELGRGDRDAPCVIDATLAHRFSMVRPVYAVVALLRCMKLATPACNAYAANSCPVQWAVSGAHVAMPVLWFHKIISRGLPDGLTGVRGTLSLSSNN
jgi:hypothetical protein